jgi:hypothetical protein
MPFGEVARSVANDADEIPLLPRPALRVRFDDRHQATAEGAVARMRAARRRPVVVAGWTAGPFNGWKYESGAVFGSMPRATHPTPGDHP